MVSIIPRVDLLGNTMVDWICKLSYFRLDTLYDALADFVHVSHKRVDCAITVRELIHFLLYYSILVNNNIQNFVVCLSVELGCPTENMKVCKTNPLLCFQVDLP